MLLVQVQEFGTGTKYGLERLNQCGKRVKTTRGGERGLDKIDIETTGLDKIDIILR